MTSSWAEFYRQNAERYAQVAESGLQSTAVDSSHPRLRVARLRVARGLGLGGAAWRGLVIFVSSDGYSQCGLGFRVPPRFPTTDSFDGAFNFCRLMYSSVRREAGGQGWMTDHPDADINLSIRLGELTKTRVSVDASGRPKHFVVRPTDPALLECPWVLASDVGTVGFDDREVDGLRTYLWKGGLLWADDFWGSSAWAHWSRQSASNAS